MTDCSICKNYEPVTAKMAGQKAVKENPDVVQVVRCKDCKYYVKPSRFGYCDRHSAGVRVTQRDYCSWGERKEDE